MEDRRRFTRVRFLAPSTLNFGPQRFPTEVLDLSLKGALVKIPPEWSPPDPAAGTLELALEGSEILIHMAFQVAFQGGDRLGLECVSIDVDSMAHLRRLMELNVGDASLVGRELAHLSG